MMWSIQNFCFRKLGSDMENDEADVFERESMVRVVRWHSLECDVELVGGRCGRQEGRLEKEERQEGINGRSTVTGTLGRGETWPV